MVTNRGKVPQPTHNAPRSLPDRRIKQSSPETRVDPWYGYFAKPTISAEEAAGSGTPDMDDEGAWIPNGPDPHGNVDPGLPRPSSITYRPHKGDFALIREWAGTSSNSTLQTAAEAPRPKSEANMNTHSCVSTAAPDNVLRVRRKPAENPYQR